MKRTLTFGALCVAGSFAVATAALAQSSSSQSTTIQSTTQSTSKPIQGRVVRYETGKSIVVVGSDGREQTFPLTASVSVPSDVAVGRTVSIVTEPSASGPAVVTRITTTSVGSDGSVRTDTETRTTNPDQSQSSSYSSQSTAPMSSTDSSSLSGQSPDPMSAGQSTTQSTTRSTTTQSTTNDAGITGTVTAYEPGKSVTFVLPDQKTVVYTIDTTSVVPTDIAVGKTYSVQTVKSANGMVVKKITTTTKTTTKQTNP